MLDFKLKSVASTEICFVNKKDDGNVLSLHAEYTYNVKYSSDFTCKGELTAFINDKAEPQKFNIKVVTLGIFKFDKNADKDLLHMNTFKALFPYVKTLITTITANAGITPIIIPEIDIENHEIYRIEKQ